MIDKMWDIVGGGIDDSMVLEASLENVQIYFKNQKRIIRRRIIGAVACLLLVSSFAVIRFSIIDSNKIDSNMKGEEEHFIPECMTGSETTGTETESLYD